MPLVAGTIIDEARGLHPSFDEQTHPNKICWQFLNRWQKSVLQRALIRYPELADDGPTTILLPLADFAAGEPLESLYAIQEGDIVLGDRRLPFTLIHYSHRHGVQPMWSGYVLNQRLFLNGEPADWTGVSAIELRWMATPADLVDLDSELVLLDSAHEMAVAAVAGFMASRQISRTEGDLPDAAAFVGMAGKAEEDFLNGLWLISSATTHYIREIM